MLTACTDDGGAPPVPDSGAPTATAAPSTPTEMPTATAVPTSEPTATPEPTPVPTATREPTPEPTPVPPVAELPIVDLHFHPEPGWGDLDALFDRVGVRAAGNGAMAPDSVAIELAERHAGRVIPFGGGHELRRLVLEHGERAWNLEVGATEAYLDALEAELVRGRLRGIGELHVNNSSSYIAGSPRYRFPADSPLMQRLFDLSARHGIPVSVHMDAEPESVEQMERLLASNREGTWLWAHTGHVAEPALLHRLLEAHPNLYCELSYRISIMSSRTAIPMDEAGRLREEWRELLEAFPDRFVIGTDLSAPSPASYVAVIAAWRGILEQVSRETAARIAHLNAEGLVGLER
jgi:predicted TIM-barrel fold metal-dependent hydrolase